MTTQQLDFLLATTSRTRRNMESILRPFTEEGLNKIPEGFNNNLAWNFAHVIVTQQLLTYGRVGIKAPVDPELIATFRKGTAPERTYTEKEVADWFELGQKTLIQFRLDYDEGLFKDFSEYETSYGITLHSIEEAVAFNLAHEGLHFGVVAAMRRLV